MLCGVCDDLRDAQELVALVEEFGGAGSQAGLAVSIGRIVRHHDENGAPAVATERPQDVEAAALAQVEVEQDDVGCRAGNAGDRVDGGYRLAAAAGVALLDHLGHARANGGGVLDEVDRDALGMSGLHGPNYPSCGQARPSALGSTAGSADSDCG